MSHIQAIDNMNVYFNKEKNISIQFVVFLLN